MPASAICISRAIWTGAETIAENVAAELNFRCVDEEILSLAAEKRNLSKEAVASEEAPKSLLAQLFADIKRGGVGEVINYIPGQRTVPQATDDMRVMIRDAIMDTVNTGNVVIVAHAASYAVGPRKDVLRVLVTGSPVARAARWMASAGGKGPREAAELLQASDDARANYVKRFYEIDHESPGDYDLVLSTDKLSSEAIVALICNAASALDPEHPEVSPKQTGWDLPPTPRSPNDY